MGKYLLLLQEMGKGWIFDEIIAYLVEKERVRQGRAANPTTGAIDSQSVKKVSLISLDTGIDGGKNINGRKRNIVVDTLGLPLAIFVCAANVHDSIAAIELLPILHKSSNKLKIIHADNAFKGDFIVSAGWYGYKIEITQKPPTDKGFVPQTGRWQVERSFSWQNFYRRLSKDFEKTTEVSVAFMQLAFSSIFLAKF